MLWRDSSSRRYLRQIIYLRQIWAWANEFGTESNRPDWNTNHPSTTVKYKTRCEIENILSNKATHPDEVSHPSSNRAEKSLIGSIPHQRGASFRPLFLSSGFFQSHIGNFQIFLMKCLKIYDLPCLENSLSECDTVWAFTIWGRRNFKQLIRSKIPNHPLAKFPKKFLKST